MQKLKIRRIGNSLGAIFPAEMLDRYKLKEGEEVFVIEEEDGFRLTAYDPEFEAVMEAYEEGRRQYRNTLRKLAE
jgi:putative addiction module antidote